MNTILMRVAAIALGLAITNFASAAGPGGRGGGGNRNSGGSRMNWSPQGYPAGSYASRTSGFGYSYSKENFYWDYQGYSSKFGCTVYWCPNESCYYYWYQPALSFYPVSYITAFAPPAVTPPVVSTTVPVPPKATQENAGSDTVVVMETPGPPWAIPPEPAQRPAGVPQVP
jgi:hypothetical protein